MIACLYSKYSKRPGDLSSKSRKLEKPFVKLRPAYSVKLFFSYVVKGIEVKIAAKSRASRRLRFKNTKIIKSPEKFRDFRETGPRPQFKGWIALSPGKITIQNKYNQKLLSYPVDGASTPLNNWGQQYFG